MSKYKCAKASKFEFNQQKNENYIFNFPENFQIPSSFTDPYGISNILSNQERNFAKKNDAT